MELDNPSPVMIQYNAPQWFTMKSSSIPIISHCLIGLDLTQAYKYKHQICYVMQMKEYHFFPGIHFEFLCGYQYLSFPSFIIVIFFFFTIRSYLIRLF